MKMEDTQNLINFMFQLVLQTKTYPELNNFIVNFKHIINEKDNRGMTPLMYVCECYNFETIKTLIQHGANINLGHNNYTPLVIACNTKNVALVHFLIKNGANIHAKGEYGYDALSIADYDGTEDSLNIIQLLLDHGANINTINKDGDTPLILAAKYSNNSATALEVVKLLIKNDADINMVNKAGYNALMVSCYFSNLCSNIKTVKYLLHHGFVIPTIDQFKVLCVTETCSIETIKLLLTYYDNNCVNGLCYNTIPKANMKVKELILQYCDIDTLYALYSNPTYKTKVNQELCKRTIIRDNEIKIKVKNYERVIKLIPEHNAAIRYKIGNMGHKICKYDFDKIPSHDIMNYLSANEKNLQQKVNDYLYNH